MKKWYERVWCMIAHGRYWYKVYGGAKSPDPTYCPKCQSTWRGARWP